LSEPFVEVHPADAKAMDLADGGFARVSTRRGSCLLKVVVSDRQRRGSLFAPIHWSDVTASAARICDLVMPETDRYSGRPDAKATPAAITPVRFSYRGFALTRRPVDLPKGTWWARVAVAKASGLLLATNDGPEIWRSRPRDMLGDSAELAEYADDPRGIYRAAAFVEDELTGCLFIGPAETAPQWDAVKALFEVETLKDDTRRVLLSGRSADGLPAPGPSSAPASASGSPPSAMRSPALPPPSKASAKRFGPALIAARACRSSSESSPMPARRRLLPRHHRSLGKLSWRRAPPQGALLRAFAKGPAELPRRVDAL
jgi:assimilatory nitrate reductase catalytic subunit